MWRRIQKTLATLLPILFLLAALVLAASYLNRWDSMVPLTLVPVWAWAGFGMALSLFAWVVARGTGLLVTFCLFLALGVAFSEETRGLLREFSRSIEPKTLPEGRVLVRVVSFDLEGDDSDLRRLADWEPQILLLQGVPDEGPLAEFGEAMHGERSVFLVEGGLAILARGELLNSLAEENGKVLHARLRLPGGLIVDTSTLELGRCVPTYTLWNPATWHALAEARTTNRRQLRSYQGEHQISLATTARIIGGAFNTPPGDDAFRPLEGNGMVDVHRVAGLGWGNTYPGDYPALRLDQIWVSANLEPFETRTRMIPGTNRRAVVSDLLLPE
jgi:hypothetical protein